MLITFRSAADADVLMLGTIGQQMLQILGKDPQDKRGIVTVAQLPAAIAALDAAFAQHEAQRKQNAPDEDDPETPRGMAAHVSLSQRIVPLANLLRRALAEDAVVTWEAT
ncbi:DUF1840 domain-containing protein [Viridibacterium curvum]|uniref:DUF1840 domain-containing protein n=1 Tax=Viridibacterium curvum TaxID=1101404 RepID=A0ABP9QPN3_9RHOO